MQKEEIPNEVLLAEIATLLARGKEVVLKVRGVSMLPFIWHEVDSVLLRKEEHPQVGDVLLVRTTRGNFVLHRVIRIEDGLLTLMGDGNCRGTEQCTPENIAGKAIQIIRGKTGKRVDLYSPRMRMAAQLWKWALPLRRYLLKLYRISMHLP